MRELLHGPARFTELRRALPGISAHTLTHRLRQFEIHGIVIRHSYPEVPPRVVYELTEVGRQLEPVLAAMNTWGRNAPVRVLTGGAARSGAGPDAVEPAPR